MLSTAAASILPPSDDLRPCGPAVLQLLANASPSSHPSAAKALIQLATDRINAFPYTEVPLCWRRLYTDASIMLAAELASVPESIGKEREEGATRAREAIEQLDKALVIAGAPGQGRDTLVHALIKELQQHIPPRTLVGEEERPRPRKRRRMSINSSFTIKRALPTFAVDEVPGFAAQIAKGPFVVRSLAADWPAVDRWKSRTYLSDLVGPGRVVPVEIGADYTHAEWGQRILPFSEFLDSLGLDDAPGSDAGIMYLAQHDLFRQFPALRADILVPDYVYSFPEETETYKAPCNEDGYVVNAWLGPAGTNSPAHTDPYYNVYVQAVGSKWVWVAPPSVTPHMASFSSSSSTDDDDSATLAAEYMTNTSRLDVSSPEQAEPSARRTFEEHVEPVAMQVVLTPGDLLVMPPGWWHSMKSLSTSFSVSFWF